MKSTGAWSSIELQWLDLKTGHQGSSFENSHQGNMPHYRAAGPVPKFDKMSHFNLLTSMIFFENLEY